MEYISRFVSLQVLLSVVTLTIGADDARAQAPATMSYQGLLTDGAGTPVTGNYNLVFRIFDAATAGNQLWTETRNGVPVADGVYSITVGTVTPLGSIDFNTPLWFEVLVNGVKQTPRTALAGVPFAMGVRLPFSETASYSGSAVLVRNAGSNGTGIEGEGQSAGVLGTATGAGMVAGVRGQTSSELGYGVHGDATASVGDTYGVYGTTASEDGYGVRGIASASIGWASGVYGTSTSTGGNGVYGFATASTGTAIGVRGISSSTEGMGVFGYAQAGTGTTYGVHGRTNSSGGYGVFGEAAIGTGVGVYGLGSIGVLARSEAANGAGLRAFADGTGSTAAVLGSAGSVSGKGVSGNGATGVFGETTYASGRAVWGKASSFPGLNYGVYGETVSADGFAGYFVGGVGVYVGANLGVGTSNPQGHVHISKDASFSKAQLLVEENATNDFSRIRMKNTSNALFWDVAVGGPTNDALNFFREGVGDIMSLRSSQRVGINNTAPAHPLHVGTNNQTGNGAHVTAGGAWTNGSSRTFKQNFAPVDANQILESVANLPISRWTYSGGADGTHIGPVAEDFAAAFNTGADERYISTVDADGVALAAIKALYERQVAETNRLEGLVQELAIRITQLENR